MSDSDDPKEALAHLTAATTQLQTAETAYELARVTTFKAVVAALKAGAEPTRVAEASPYSAAYVRKIARENGIEPARRGVKKKAVSSLKVTDLSD